MLSCSAVSDVGLERPPHSSNLAATISLHINNVSDTIRFLINLYGFLRLPEGHIGLSLLGRPVDARSIQEAQLLLRQRAYDKISDSGRSASRNHNHKYDLCKFI